MLALCSSALVIFGILCVPVSAAKFDSSWIGEVYDISGSLQAGDPAEDADSFYSFDRSLMSSRPFVFSSGSSSAVSSDAPVPVTVSLLSGSPMLPAGASDYPVRYRGIFWGQSSPNDFIQRTGGYYSGTFGFGLSRPYVDNDLVFTGYSSPVRDPTVFYSQASYIQFEYPSFEFDSFIYRVPVSLDKAYQSVSLQFDFDGASPSSIVLNSSGDDLSFSWPWDGQVFVTASGGLQQSVSIGGITYLDFDSPVSSFYIDFVLPSRFSLGAPLATNLLLHDTGRLEDSDYFWSSSSIGFSYLLSFPVASSVTVQPFEIAGLLALQNKTSDLNSAFDDYASAEDQFVDDADQSISSALPSDFGSSLDSDTSEGLSGALSSFNGIWGALPSGFLTYFLAFMTVGLAAFILRRVG